MGEDAGNDDMTGQAAEEALRRSEARFRAFVDAGTDVVHSMNADWTALRLRDGRGRRGSERQRQAGSSDNGSRLHDRRPRRARGK